MTKAPIELTELMAEDRNLRLVEDGIYSVLAESSVLHHYDRRAAIYDSVVGTRLYNSVMWGSSPAEYAAFARDAVAANNRGKFLDAGCGSLLFTAQAYVNSPRTIIACDQSLTMLRRGRKRLLNLCGGPPAHIVLLQAELTDLPFRADSFSGVLCMNVLNLFESAAELVSSLKQLLTPEGKLCLTSLVLTGRWIGDRYLKALHAAGELVCPRSNLELQELVERCLDQKVNYLVKGNMAFLSTAKLH